MHVLKAMDTLEPPIRELTPKEVIDKCIDFSRNTKRYGLVKIPLRIHLSMSFKSWRTAQKKPNASKN